MDNPSEFPAKKKDEGVGPLIAIIIVITLLAIGGVYFVITQENKPQETPAGQTQL